MTDRFLPNERINILDKPLTKLTQCGSSTLCNYPNRIHITPIDCNKFGFGISGGGGIGFAIKMNNNLSIKIIDSKNHIFFGSNEYKAITLRALFIICKQLGLNHKFEVKLELSNKSFPHSGLGSHACLMTSILKSINSLFNSPLDDYEIAKLVGLNYAETDGNKCITGLDTGVAPSTTLYGGFCLTTMHSILIWQNKFDFLKDIFVIQPFNFDNYYRDEEAKIFKQSQIDDIKDRGHLSYEILMNLIPSINDKDISLIGDIIWEIQFRGSHLSIIQSYLDKGGVIYSLLGRLKFIGAEIVGISSVGPNIFVCTNKAKEIESFLTSNKIGYFRTTVHDEKLKINIQ